MHADRIILCGGCPPPPRTRAEQIVALNLTGASANVNLKITDLARRLSSDVPDVLVDLVEIASYVYCADQAITRGGDGALAVGKHWRRLHFHIPVRLPDLWSAAEVSEALRDTLSFLSEDEYDFRFTQLIEAPPMQRYLELGGQQSGFSDPDEVLLFSGGLDSLGGVVQEAVRHGRKVALVSPRSSPKIHSRQRQLVADLAARCGETSRPLHVPVWVHKTGEEAREFTQRSRSFLYAALATAVAKMFDLSRIRFYENGVTSLNLPISEQAIGARASRTTHPQVLNGFAGLFSRLLGQPFAVENPFLWNTKAEIVNLIGDAGCGELIKHSVSCMHTRDQTIQLTHCGRCPQCISRRFATLASRYAGCDPAEMYKVDLLLGERKKGPELTLVESFIRSATDIKSMNEFQRIERYGEISRVLRHVQPLTADEVAEGVIRLHRIHAGEVTRVMDAAIAEHASEIREEKLPATCAVILAVPRSYKVARAEQPQPVAAWRDQPAPADGDDGRIKLPYSETDDRIFRVVGEQNLRVVTNEDIQRRYRIQIRQVLKRDPSLNALRPRLNRIRRYHSLPMSNEIRKNSVNK